MRVDLINKKMKKGFTLIELLLVVSLLGITFGVTSDILISLVRSQAKTQVSNSLEQQANFFSLKLEKDLRNAYAVEEYNYSGNTDAIKISGKVNGTPYEVYYYCSNCSTLPARGVIYRQGDGLASAIPLTSNTVPGGVVTYISSGKCFTVTAGTPTKLAVNLRFSPAVAATEAVTPTTGGFVDINSLFVVRGTY